LRIAELVGGDVLNITDPGSGWPALGTLQLDSGPLPVSLFAGPVGLSHRNRDSLFAGPVGLSHRNRDDVERRFQNPGPERPITTMPGRYPLLLGLWDKDPHLPVPKPLLVQADPGRRVGLATRYSIFVSVPTLLEASATGWSEYTNDTGEFIHCLAPPLLPVIVSALRGDVNLANNEMHAAINGSGLLDFPDYQSPAAERARRAGTALVRDARFARRVTQAYKGFCAMCGIGANLIQAAHIYPASAPGSRDEPWNGLALCPNHHLAFDRYLMAIHPDTREIIYSQEMRAQAKSSPAMAAFVAATYEQLAEPSETSARPASKMFTDRYDYYRQQYGWLDTGV
jgi:hypothetical protein